MWTSFRPASSKRPIGWGSEFTIRNGNRVFLANDHGELIISKLSPDGYEEISRAKLIEPTHQLSCLVTSIVCKPRRLSTQRPRNSVSALFWKLATVNVFRLRAIIEPTKATSMSTAILLQESEIYLLAQVELN